MRVGVLLDLDGTLLDTESPIVASFRAALAAAMTPRFKVL